MTALFVISYLIGWFVCAIVVYRSLAWNDDPVDQTLAGVLGALTGILWPVVLLGAAVMAASKWLDTRLEEKDDVL
jgi:uncharacterized membrane protein YciS (DUF1049 family)